MRKFKSQMPQRINTCFPVYRDISRDTSDIGQSRAGDENLRDVSAIYKTISTDVRAEVSSSKTKSLSKNCDKKEKGSEAQTDPSCRMWSLANV